MGVLMQQLIDDFISLIGEECLVADDLVDLGMIKQKIIVANDIEQLDVLLKKENNLVAKFTRLESSRYGMQEQLTDFYNIQEPAITASVLTDRIQQDNQALALQLKEAIGKLNTIVDQLREINNHNNELIGFSLDYLGFLQSIYEGDVAGVYSHDGQPEEGRAYLPSRKMLDRKV